MDEYLYDFMINVSEFIYYKDGKITKQKFEY